ncbi:MAG TPA: phosphomethylpyrimidine synthase ThiC [Candidatus Omnitrophota bacterium]|nr:phosphomethylpyrimidine synthase ThiC [Candidatus Omnitrophota bacterium]
MYKQLIKDDKFKEVIKKTASIEKIPVKDIENGILKGECVITANIKKKLGRPCVIGKGTTTKVNVNIGTSTDKPDLKDELEKLEISVDLGADAVMDLSLGGDLRKNRLAIIKNSPLPIGTVPIYEAAMRAQKNRGSFLKLEKNEIFDVLEEQAEDGVDFFTIHCGINHKSLDVFLKNRRVLDVVSRGGALLVNWMKKNNKENPFYEYYDEVLKLAKKYNITLSLGDGMRPGSIMDATDKPQIAELIELGKLADRARDAGVQVIIEGPGHVPLHQIKKNMELEKKLCKGAPFYVLGPLVTDIGLGYDHISGAIGGALAAWFGADFLCYLTPSEHVRHPSVQDAREGLIASKIAAHAADIAKGLKNANNPDRLISIARKNRDWNKQISLALDPGKAKSYRASSSPKIKEVCTMCGEFCSIKLIDECLH